jgi:hypothetical protein
MTGQTMPGRDPDVLTQLTDQLDALQEHVWEKVQAGRRGERNRMRLLYLHAWFALLTSPLFLVWANGPVGFTGVTWKLLATLPGAELWMPALLFTGGAVLALAVAAREPLWAGVGLLLVLLWYTIVAASFFGAVVVWITDGTPAPWPAVYAPFVYAHLAAIMLVHLRTVWSLIRSVGE